MKTTQMDEEGFYGDDISDGKTVQVWGRYARKITGRFTGSYSTKWKYFSEIYRLNSDGSSTFLREREC